MNSIILKLKRRKDLLKVFSSVIVFNLFVSISFQIFSNNIDSSSINNNVIKFDSIYEEIAIVVILAPLFETLIFQNLLIELTLKLTNKYIVKYSYYLAILLPSICFALSHGYNYLYIINTFLGGLSLNFLYLFIRENYSHQFLLTAIAHSTYNILIFCLKHV